MHVSGDAPMTWAQPMTPVGARSMTLDEGWTLTTWTGADGTPLDEAMGAADDVLAALASFDASNQKFRVYRPGVPPFGPAPTLQHGDAFWLLMESDDTWLQAAP